jgi:eukaryotic-like serine/threonine-protein kinase
MAIVWRPGQIIKNGRFKVLKDLGSGGFGTTYQVRELKSQQMKDVAEPRLLALKILNSKQQGRSDFSEQQERFMNEAMNLKGFDAHPNIVKVLEVVEVVESSEFNGQQREERVWGMLMEWIDGENLEVYVDRRRLREKEALQYIEQIGAALIYVHSKDVLHRDVKPSNILLEKSLTIGASRRPVLIDFGLAREFISNKTMDASNIGTQFYAPIEQYDRKFQPGEYRQVRLGKYTDVYALAATLYNLLTDQHPIPACYRRSNSGGDMLPSPQSFNSQISDRVNQAILCGMALDYGDRPQSIEEFLALLKPPIPLVVPDPIETPKMPARTEPAASSSPSVQPSERPKGTPKPQGRFRIIKPPVVPVQPEQAKAIPNPVVDPVAKQRPRPQEQKAPAKEPPRRTSDRNPVASVADVKPLMSRRSLVYGGLAVIVTGGAVAFWPKNNETGNNLQSGSTEGAGLKSFGFETVNLNDRGIVQQRQQSTAKGFIEELGGNVSIGMLRIPAGKFMMGQTAAEKQQLLKAYGEERYKQYFTDEFPQHEVQVPEFYMGQNLVTQAQWQAIMGSNPSKFKGDAKLPVDSVSWLDAMDFCQKLSQKTGRTYRLPSEAEWEYACRAGTATPFAFGEAISPATVNYNGNYPYGNAAKGEYREKTTLVGSFPANAFGLHDMHGNLWEWCLDEWVDNYNNAPVDGSPRGDIKSRANDKQRLLRGGSWYINANFCRSAYRLPDAASYRDGIIGFRLLAVAPRTS